MWYVGEGFAGNRLCYAESKDGIRWQRRRGEYKGGSILDDGSVISVSVIKEEDNRFTMAYLAKGRVHKATSDDGIKWNIEPKPIISNAAEDTLRFDSESLNKVSLVKKDETYYLFYSGSRNEKKRPFPTEKDMQKMSTRELYELGKMVGLQMQWDKQKNIKNLSYSKIILEQPEELGRFSYSQIRKIAKAYKLKIDLQSDEIGKIDRRKIIMTIRKIFLNRCFAKYGKTIEYPSVEEVEKMSRSALVKNCIKYDIKGIGNLQTETTANLRRASKTFSELARGRKEVLQRYSKDELMKIVSDYNIDVTLEDRDLVEELNNIARSVIESWIIKTVRGRYDIYIGKQPLVSRIGLASSSDGTTWKKFEGDEVGKSVLSNFPGGKTNPLVAAEGKFGDIITILSWFAIGLGMVNLFRHHGGVVLKREKLWPFSMVFFIAFFSALSLAITYYPRSVRFIQGPSPYKFFEDFITQPLVATIMGLLGFYITSAAYRAFRIRTAEASVMMLVALLCMLGNVVLLEPLTKRWLVHTVFDQLHFPYLRYWLMSSGNAAVFRGLNFGISIGVIAMSIRLILGIERGAFFERL